MSSLRFLALLLVLTVTTSAKPFAGGDVPQLESDKIDVVKIVEHKDEEDRGLAEPPDDTHDEVIDLDDEDEEPEMSSTKSAETSPAGEPDDGGLLPKKSMDEANEKTTSWISRNFVVFLVICGVAGLLIVLLICICICKMCK